MGGRSDRQTDGRVDGWTDGWVDGRTDRQTDGWTDGWMDTINKHDNHINVHKHQLSIVQIVFERSSIAYHHYDLYTHKTDYYQFIPNYFPQKMHRLTKSDSSPSFKISSKFLLFQFLAVFHTFSNIIRCIRIIIFSIICMVLDHDHATFLKSHCIIMFERTQIYIKSQSTK